MFNPLP